MRHRNQSLEFLRILAAAAVVCVHVAGTDVLARPDVHSIDWWVGNFYSSMVRWCVPIFVMVSGAVLLSQTPHISPVEFYQRRLRRLIPLTVFWTLFYLGWQTHLRFDGEAMTRMIFQGQTHLWYLYMTVGLYLVAPLLSQFLASSLRRMTLGAIVLSFGTAAGYGIVKQYSIDPRAGYSIFEWPLYVGYFLVGHYLAQTDSKPRDAVFRWRYLGLALLCGIATTLLTGAMLPWLGITADSAIMYFYLNPLVIAMSILVFIAVYRSTSAEETAESRTIAVLMRVAPYTLGIYVIHPLSLRVLFHLGIKPEIFAPIIGVPLVTLTAFALSLAIAYVIGLVPLSRRLVM